MNQNYSYEALKRWKDVTKTAQLHVQFGSFLWRILKSHNSDLQYVNEADRNEIGRALSDRIHG